MSILTVGEVIVCENVQILGDKTTLTYHGGGTGCKYTSNFNNKLYIWVQQFSFLAEVNKSEKWANSLFCLNTAVLLKAKKKS
jgi:hypothetical protein